MGLNRTELVNLLLDNRKTEAVKLVIDQTDLNLKEAKVYIDTLCVEEKIGAEKTCSYSAIKENGVITYYRNEGGEKYVVSKCDVPAFLVNRVEGSGHFQDNIDQQKNKAPSHKKGRKILLYVSIPFLALGLFFLYRICTVSEPSFSEFGGAVASCGMVLVFYFIMLLLYIDEVIAGRRKKRAEEMEVPEVFDIRDRHSLGLFWWIPEIICSCVDGIALWRGCLSLYNRDISGAVGAFGSFILIGAVTLYFIWTKYKSSKLRLHISGANMYILNGGSEETALLASSTVCMFPWELRAYPCVILEAGDGKRLVKMYLDLPSYHLLKKYLIQQGAYVDDHYNKY